MKTLAQNVEGTQIPNSGHWSPDFVNDYHRMHQVQVAQPRAPRRVTLLPERQV